MKHVALVTGAEGFIGSHLVNFLHADGWHVVGTYLQETPLLRATAACVPRKGQRSELVACDIRDANRLAELMRDVAPAYVFHLAAQSLPTVSWQDPVFTFESNIMGSLHLFEAVRRSPQMPVVVAACSSAEYGFVHPKEIPVQETHALAPLHPYGVSKAALDLMAYQYYVNHKLPCVRLRLFNTTGPGKTNDAPSDFVRQLARIKNGAQGPIVRVGNLETKRAFLDVMDTVRAFVLAAIKGRPGEVYNICAKRAYQMNEVLRTAIKISGTNPEIRPVAELMRPSDERVIFGSTTKFRRDTGWKPQVLLASTLNRMFEYWLATGDVEASCRSVAA